MLLILSAIVLGFLHGLGADHLMAIAALTVAGEDSPAVRRARAITVAVRFAAGHALVLALGASAVIVIGWTIPASIERGGEVLGGVLLIGLGATALAAAVSGRVYAHAHRHAIDPGAWHLHLGRPGGHGFATHSQLAGVLGAVFAVSSLRALSTLAPFGTSASAAAVSQILLLIALFAVGIVISMSLFGVALARALSTRVVMQLGRGAAILMALASTGLGCYWVAMAW